MSTYHTPVLLKASIDALLSGNSGIYIDATFGGGGHTAEILSRLNQSGRVIAFDRDEDAIAACPVKDDRLTLVRGDFRFIENHLALAAGKDALADGVLADLGVSSHQFDTPERGFSFRYDAPLDMRMNREAPRSAADLINGCSEKEIADILRLYGEVGNAGRMAALIVKARSVKPILTTGDLDSALEPALPKMAAHKELAKIYQALRIEVNQEMRALEKFLEGAARILRPGGKLAVITYHSLEDRMVKNFIRSGNTRGEQEKDIYGENKAPLEPAFRKPIVPEEAEIASNTRARSAKLRVAIKKEEKS